MCDRSAFQSYMIISNMRLVFRTGALAVLVCAGLAAQAPGVNPFANNAAEAGLGKGIFRVSCAACHGIRARGGRGPDLTRGVYSCGDNDADLFRTIAEGIPGTDMGAYSRFSDENIWRLVAYIRSTTDAAAAGTARGDAAKGEEIFWKSGNCGACHAVGLKGNRMGPDLTRIGRQRSLQYLRDSIIDPSKDITPGYWALTVVTKDGKRISGLQKGLDNFTAQISELNGNFRSFDRSELKSLTREKASLMPPSRLTAEQVDDLVNYLVSLRGETK
jgi:putative heme-binding domain-containing protein